MYHFYHLSLLQNNVEPLMQAAPNPKTLIVFLLVLLLS